ncbi:MAG: guanylate kinase [Lachnospiraceae bacterium]|nr:guanylate kinase [Lachnospiraceae bacterium]
MGRIFYVMGKSASGKDTIYNRLMEEEEFQFKNIVGYTTRPMRENEIEGREYHFVDERELEELERQGKVVEKRGYDTVYGKWYYCTVDDGSIDFEHENYLLIGTLEAYRDLCGYFGRNRLVPIYIEVEDFVRLTRAMERERRQTMPKYTEMCRRFIADAEDFSEEKISEAGIEKKYVNLDFTYCYEQIKNDIKREISRKS